MTRTMSLAQAKASFSEAVRSAESGVPVVLTRHGKQVVALVRSEDLEQFERLRAAGPSAGLAGIAGGWEGSDDLVEQAINGRRTQPRSLPGMD